MGILLAIGTVLAGTVSEARGQISRFGAGADQGDPRWDETTGKTRESFPPDLEFDYEHLKLEMDIGNLEVPRFEATATIRATAIGRARRTMTLNAINKTIAISKVVADGVPAKFTHERDELRIEFPAPVAAGLETMVTIEYVATNPFEEGSGLNWFKSRRRENRTEAAMIYSQGQSQFNRLWIPLHDYPNDRLSSEIVVTLPTEAASGSTANGERMGEVQTISNGKLISRDLVENGKRTRWHWLQEKPHASYLIMLAAGVFDRVDVGGDASARPGLEMAVYGPPGTANDLKKVFENTAEMVKLYEKLLDEPYPWDKYSQVIVRNFRWGGMENTSATILAEYAGQGDQDDLIAHELIHQWMGNLITCKSWEHLWLNEGWATFGEWLWIEHRDGRAGYLRAVRSAKNRLSILPLSEAPMGVPVVSNIYSHPDDTFLKPEDPYVRGGLLLHMLRERLGDEPFFRGVREYVNRFKFKQVETDDFRHVMEEVSGQSLQRFFEQWAMRPSMPELDVKTSFARDEGGTGGTYTVTVVQKQKIDQYNPAYAMSLPIYLVFPNAAPGAGEDGAGRNQWISIDIDSRETKATFTLSDKPESFRIDPNASVLAKYSRQRGGED